MRTSRPSNPCDECRMFDRLQHPALFCRACVESGRYAEQQHKIEQRWQWRKESA
ncbi:MAG: hypothetical protein J6T35_05005 [Bacteroidales bacterium]|nr:hypothetical protein [Bacteroidales bacterium]